MGKELMLRKSAPALHAPEHTGPTTPPNLKIQLLHTGEEPWPCGHVALAGSVLRSHCVNSRFSMSEDRSQSLYRITSTVLKFYIQVKVVW